MPQDNTHHLGQQQYVSLETFRRDGRAVATPVWIAEADGRLVAFSMADAGKVKRIRATKRVRMAPCTFRGRVTGAWHHGSGLVLSDPDAIEAAKQALKKKYGLLGWFTFTLGGLGGREARRAYLALSLNEPSAD